MFGIAELTKPNPHINGIRIELAQLLISKILHSEIEEACNQTFKRIYKDELKLFYHQAKNMPKPAHLSKSAPQIQPNVE